MPPPSPRTRLLAATNIGSRVGIVSTAAMALFFFISLQSVAQNATVSKLSPQPSAASLQQATLAFKAGSAAYEKGDLATARRSFERAVHLAPNVAAAHAALGSVLLAAGDPSAALRELQFAVALAPSDPTTLLNLALAQSAAHQNAQAVETLHRLQPLDPQQDLLRGRDVVLPLAASLAAVGDLPGAEALLAKALAAAPDDVALLDALGTVEARRGDIAHAELTLHRATTLDESFPAAHFHLGSLYLQQNQLDVAAVELSRAHALEPGNVSFTVQFAHAWLALHRDTEAISLLRDALTHSPAGQPETIDLEYQLALVLQATGEVQEALPLFATVLKSRPDAPEVLSNAGLAHVQTGDAVGGVTLYLRALKLSPNDPTLRENLGVGYLQQSDLDDALTQFHAGLALDPDNPQLHYDLALAFKLKDNLAAAIPEFERAAALDPSLPDPPYTLGILFMQQSRFPEAAASLARALALRPDNGDGWATLGSVYRQMDQPDKAIPALERAIALTPEQPSPHITLAAIFAAQGKKAEAAAERKTAADLTRVAINHQKSSFGIDSGTVLLKRGEFAQAIVQFESAISADPASAPAHAGLAQALEQAGRKAEAAEERRKAAALTAASPAP